MRGLKKNGMKRGLQRNKDTKKQTKIQRNKHTSRLLDQLGPEGRVGEKSHGKGTSNTQTHRHTDTQHTDIATTRPNRPSGPIQWKGVLGFVLAYN